MNKGLSSMDTYKMVNYLHRRYAYGIRGSFKKNMYGIRGIPLLFIILF